MTAASSVVLFDPEDVAVGRVSGDHFEDDKARIKVTYQVTLEGEVLPVSVYTPLDNFASFLVALLNGFGFPEGDLEYVAERLMRIIAAEAAAVPPKPKGKLLD